MSKKKLEVPSVSRSARVVKSHRWSRRAAGGLTLLVAGALVSAACDGGESNTDHGNDGGQGGAASGGRPAGDGGAPEGGAGGEAPSAGGTSSGGTGGNEPTGGVGGEGPAGPAPFTGFFWINNEYGTSAATRRLEVKGTFAEPDFDLDAFEDSFDAVFTTLASLEPGECGPELVTVRGFVPALQLSHPILRDGTEDLLSVSDYSDGLWNGALIGPDDDTDPLLEIPLDFHLTESEDVPAVTAENWGEIPIATNPTTSVNCFRAMGCTLAANITSDDLIIQFDTSLGRRYCRGNAEATSVTIPVNVTDQNGSAQIFYVRRHAVPLGESTIRIVVRASGEPFQLRGAMPS